MKIYHTETQEDYDALMAELEKQGCKWASGDKPSEINRWHKRGHLTCVDVCDSKISYASLNYYKEYCPDVPIIKYKAKVDEKMRFTKENVIKLTNEWIENKTVSFQDLQNEIKELDDTPEKVVVPKCFDEWYQEIKGDWQKDSSTKQFALWKLCQQGFGHNFEGVSGKKIPYGSDLGEWLFENKMLAIDAVLNGYTIEPEKLYYIPLPHLETSDGIQQVLSKRKNDKRYFASRPAEALQQRYTKAELEHVPEIYKPYATPVEEE